MTNSGRKRKTVLFLTILCLVIVFVLLLGAFDVKRLERADDATTVVSLRLFASEEKEYAKEHAREGYVCDLGRLRAWAQTKKLEYDSDFFLKSEHAGYKFVISGCESSDGVVRKYRIIAQPIQTFLERRIFRIRKTGESGWRTFCTDETGFLGYTLDVRPESCFASENIINYIID